MSNQYSKGISLILTLLVLTALLALALGIATLVSREIKLSQEIADSVIAYGAADSATERFMYAVNKKEFDPTIPNCLCANNKKYCYCDDDSMECVADSCSSGCYFSVSLSNNAAYEGCTKKEVPPLEIKTTGTYGSTNRSIQVNY